MQKQPLNSQCNYRDIRLILISDFLLVFFFSAQDLELRSAICFHI